MGATHGLGSTPKIPSLAHEFQFETRRKSPAKRKMIISIYRVCIDTSSNGASYISHGCNPWFRINPKNPLAGARISIQNETQIASETENDYFNLPGLH